MNTEEMRISWLTLEQSWLDAHINAKELREKADKARDRYAKAMADEYKESDK